MNILVTGGAGYIGSHTSSELIKKGHNVVVFDDLSKGHEKAVPKKAKIILGDVSDKEALVKALKENKIDAVMHFAGSIEVGESVKDPAKYFHNNLIHGISLLDAMIEAGCKKIIFSSSAAVYGEPERIPIKEDDKTNPRNPYGFTKRMFESVLKSYDEAYGIKYVSLRYFNAAGADLSGENGEMHNPETHLIPIIMQAAAGERESANIYGTDYDTKDGTCIRDYIHVVDIAIAHVLALEALMKNNESRTYNLGNGHGYSVKEIIEMAEKITGKKINAIEAERREGDPAILIADYSKISKELGWMPRYGIKEIIESAWKWHSRMRKY